MISPLSRSDASARADIARSCAFSFPTASCSAAVSTAVSPPPRVDGRVLRAAAQKRTATNASIAATASAAMIAVSPRNAYALGDMRQK